MKNPFVDWEPFWNKIPLLCASVVDNHDSFLESKLTLHFLPERRREKN
jgi:hypothetical protein